MTDDYRTFRAIDEAAYGPDRPGDTILLRRAARQVGALLEYPRGLTRGERSQADGTAPKLHAAAPRVSHYQPRRIPAGLPALRAMVPVAGSQREIFEVEGATIGRIRLVVRIGETVRASDWQTCVERQVTDPEVHTLTCEFPAPARDAIGECWIVFESEPFERRDTRGLGSQELRNYDSVSQTAADPYPESYGIYAQRDRRFVDLILTAPSQVQEGNQIFHWNPGGRMQVPDDQDNALGIPEVDNYGIWKMANLRFPHGVEIRPQWNTGVEEVADETLLAGEVPRFTPGPGEIKRGLERELKRYWPSGSGPQHQDKKTANFRRADRTPYYAGETGTYEITSYSPQVVFRPRAADIRVELLAGVIAFDNASTFNGAGDVETYDEYKALGRPLQFDISCFVRGPVTSYGFTTDTWTVQSFPLQVFSTRVGWPHLVAMSVNNQGNGERSWVYRDGLPFAGYDQSTRQDTFPERAVSDVATGDMQLISLQRVALEATGCPTDAPLRVEVDYDSALGDDQLLTWIGLTANQRVL